MRPLARIGLLLAAVCAMAHARAVRADDEPKKPVNVVLIVCDDLGYGDLGCYGNERFKTPNIDRMAKEGARLTHFTSCSPAGAGSRVALQTGRYPFRTKLVDSPRPEKGFDQLGIPAEEITLGELFRDAGYATACIGKWQLGLQSPFMPTENGYDEYFGLLGSNDDHPVRLFRNDRIYLSVVFQPRLTTEYTREALQFIEAHQGGPFFLYLAHTMPHKPLAPGDNFYHTSGAGLYGDVMAELDVSVGAVLAKLADLKLDEQTLVIFTSDNGPWFGGSTGGLRGMKGETWEGGLRVPLVARWPKHIPEGHESAQPATIADVFSTALAAAGIKPPADRVIDSRDLMPLLTSDAKSPHHAIYSFVGSTLCTVRSGKWKLHTPASGPRFHPAPSPYERWVDPKAPDGLTILAPRDQPQPSHAPGVFTGFSTDGFALVDLEEDPSEQTDVSAKQSGVMAELKAEAEKIAAEVAKIIPPPADAQQPPANAPK